MSNRAVLLCVALLLTAAPAALATSSQEKFRNEKVAVTELTLQPGDAAAFTGENASMVVFLDAGSAAFVGGRESSGARSIKRGETIAVETPGETIRNSGSQTLSLVRVVFLTAGLEQTWGMTCLAPSYKILVENKYARAYDIKIPPQTFEPQHTHHDRVVICLSGAKLEHILPDGSRQPSDLKTGDVLWRLGQTHTGHNLGNTELWCIAIEPK